MTFSSFKILTTAFPIPSTPYQLANWTVSLKISQPCWLCLRAGAGWGGCAGERYHNPYLWATLPKSLSASSSSTLTGGVQANLNLQRYFNFYHKDLKSLLANPVYSPSGVIFSLLSNRDQVSFLLCNSSAGPFLGELSPSQCAWTFLISSQRLDDVSKGSFSSNSQAQGITYIGIASSLTGIGRTAIGSTALSLQREL